MQITQFLPEERIFPSRLGDAPNKSIRRLGEILTVSGHLSPKNLRLALMQKYRSGAPLGQVLLECQMISEEVLAEAIAEQWSLERIDLGLTPPHLEQMISMDPQACLQIGCLPWRVHNNIPTLVVTNPEVLDAAKEACGYKNRFVNVAISSQSEIQSTIERYFADEFERDACITCPDHFSARNWNTMICALWGTLLILVCALAILTVPKAFFWFLFGWILCVNLLTGLFRLALVAARLWPEHKSEEETLLSPPPPLDQGLPNVTIMIGLLNEDLVLPKLLEHLANLDYPRELLQVMLLLEEGDVITPKNLASITPAREFDVVTVPKGMLKTKPRALNYGMNYAWGEIVGILDAEDRPNPDQINDVVRILHAAPPDVACVQGVLDFYNAHRNWLSRCFTIEYAIWFRVLLKGMQRLRLPIPLGGTTVYFRRNILEKVGAWDAHNVTEDADLGMRLCRYGYRTEVMQSVTMEEANGHAMSWIKQRSRWIKGYMVTWATHMRHPVGLFRDLGLSGFLTFQLLLLGGVTSYLSIPLLWSLWIGIFGFDLKLHLGGTQMLWELAFWSMIFGQVIMLVVAAAALLRQDKRALIPWIFTLPIYWPLGAIAGFKALYEVFFAPYYWDKTKHGHQSDQTTVRATSPKALMETENSPASLTA